ncbi:MAG: hypothetical protein ACYCSY_11470 [Acidiferrobacter sp.]
MDETPSADDQALIDILSQLANKAKPHFDHYASFRDDFGAAEYSRWLSQGPRIEDLQNLQKEVQLLLVRHPVFGRERSVFFGVKQLMLSPPYQSFNLLRVSCERDPEAAIAWMHGVFATTRADIRYVAEVHGLELRGRERLSNGVELVPLAELPDSPYARRLVAQYPQFLPSFHRPFSRPVGAMFEIKGVRASEALPNHPPQLGPRSDVLETTVRAFALVADASPVVGVGWIEFVDSDLALAEFGQVWSASFHESNLTSPIKTPPVVDESALEWVERYITLPLDVKRTVDVALERLALARRRYHPGNKAIEGSICLEALLGDRGSQELTYRLRLRAALLLAKELKDRVEISNAVRDFYTLRSKTVHGIAASRDSTVTDSACAERGVAICADALRAIVKLGRKYVPADWELSGGDPGSKRL